ncbi:hypothetical protein CHS0354_032013 [Potamilus streckersoni]|uniref:Uncharacterized protein n=1 Tax=Potamilus streckersoni TaxID=2493646 RepID=A0AAE0TPB2_9BIVA|nr:hypothetical protein CHS0354_032013 [Potamilus streckersoni]
MSKMELARADSYINVYLPRSDGLVNIKRNDPPSSPTFGPSGFYRFSEEIIKDRPLFLGSKTMSLYQMFPCHNSPTEMDSSERHLSPSGDQESVILPAMKTINLSINSGDKGARRSLKRFNEPLNTYITNIKRTQQMRSSDVNLSYPRLSREKTRIAYDGAFKLQSLRKPLKFPKSQSAVETRQTTSLGFPTLKPPRSELTPRSQSAAVFPENKKLTSQQQHRQQQQQKSVRFTNGMHFRPLSKPQNIWQQSNEMLQHREIPRLKRHRSTMSRDPTIISYEEMIPLY